MSIDASLAAEAIAAAEAAGSVATAVEPTVDSTEATAIAAEPIPVADSDTAQVHPATSDADPSAAQADAGEAPMEEGGSSSLSARRERRRPSTRKKESDEQAPPASGSKKPSSSSSRRRSETQGGESKRRKTSGNPHSSLLAAASAAPVHPADMDPCPAGVAPAILGMLADKEWTPKFVQTISSHLLQARAAHINWHLVSSQWRQLLSDGGWAKDTHYVIGSDPHRGRPVLVRSRRVVGDFTPWVCERLWHILRSKRDDTPAGLSRAAARMEQHERDEIAAAQLPVMHNGRATTHGMTRVKLEYTGGCPPGCAALLQRDTSSSSNSDAAGGGDLSDEDDSLDFWPALSQQSNAAMGVQVSDGASIRRWAAGHTVHVAPTDLLAPSSPDVPAPSARPQLVSALHALHGRLRTEVVERGGLLLSLSSGDWSWNGVAGEGSWGTRVQGEAIQPSTTPRWSTPHDDNNLLESIAEWVKAQPMPTPQSIVAFDAHIGATTPTTSITSAHVLPHTPDQWSAVRRCCSAHAFSLGFLRRRFWFLVTRVWSGQPVCAPPASVEEEEGVRMLVAKVARITDMVAERTDHFQRVYGAGVKSDNAPSAPAAAGSEQNIAGEQLPAHDSSAPIEQPSMEAQPSPAEQQSLAADPHIAIAATSDGAGATHADAGAAPAESVAQDESMHDTTQEAQLPPSQPQPEPQPEWQTQAPHQPPMHTPHSLDHTHPSLPAHEDTPMQPVPTEQTAADESQSQPAAAAASAHATAPAATPLEEPATLIPLDSNV